MTNMFNGLLNLLTGAVRVFQLTPLLYQNAMIFGYVGDMFCLGAQARVKQREDFRLPLIRKGRCIVTA